ncbi:death domain-containing protein 1 [Xenopus laevis]|uniref:Death domain-containing protein 1 n=2 Tax=Xenopus laevis TaxID=8355 RepID=A0A1L8HTI7_XENLA|nr:death domain-containing protein 1 [Xenopus laevis]OCT99419.1 hypothetical protein XELAEV_18005199mg [Xenopus laevis]
MKGEMELASNAENSVPILTHIKQLHQVLRCFLEEPCVNQSEELNENTVTLITSIHDLSRTFSERLLESSGHIQATILLLMDLQNKFQDFVSSNEHVRYCTTVSQIFFDTAKHLNTVQEQWNAIRSQYKDTADQKEDITEKTICDPNKNDHTNSSQSYQMGESTQQNQCRIQNESRCDETDDILIKAAEELPTNENHNSDEEENTETEQVIKHLKKTNAVPRNNEFKEKTTQKDVSQKQDIPPEPHPPNQSFDNGHTMDPTTSEVVSNGTKLQLSVERLLESEKWMYQEYVLQREGESEETVACFIKAPSYILQKLQVGYVDDISSLMVSDSEELVSSILGIRSTDTDLTIPFPLSVSIPFSSRYRGNYKDVMVKACDENLNPSYLAPHSLDGYHGNYKGTFAEVKIYKLGIFSVVSCLKKENFTIVKKGSSIKLGIDPRISLNYPPGCFRSPVIVQFKVQPIDTSIISVLKVKHDIYYSVVSTSPLVHVKQPSVQLFQKPVTVLLPCPPNPEKKKQGEEADNKRASTATAPRAPGANQLRAVSAPMRKLGENPNESLKLLAYKEDQWVILEDVVVKNVQNGIVSFEMDEHVTSFIVIRLSSAMDNGHLMSFIHSLEVATHSSMVNVILYRKKDNLQTAIVKVVPSKELTWEVANLREAGYSGPPEPSEQIQLREGEQIHFRFCGNITASVGKDFGKTFKLTFHAQRKQRLSLRLSVVDEFGNYSCPHYKGTVAVYKLSKEDIEECYKSGQSTDTYLQQRNPVCKLAVTLPKMEKNVSRPSSTKIMTSDPADIVWDSLLQWLAQELSEEDASHLVLSLPIRRSTVQLVKLKSPDNLTEQIYELLSFWKKSLPTSADKIRLLARHLRKSGRSDLLEPLKINWENKMSLQT